MRVRVDHQTTYRYQPPAKSVLQVLRLTPRSHEGQNVVRWRISAESDVEVQLRRGEDALGNVTQTAFLQGPVSELVLKVEGEVETWETQGVVIGAAERFPPEAYGAAGPSQRQAHRLHAQLASARIEDIFQSGLHEFITAFLADNARLTSAIAEQYLV